MTIRFTLVAEAEIAGVRHHYQEKSDQAARSYITRLKRAIERLCSAPETYPLVSRGRLGWPIRFLTLDRSPHALIYEVHDDEILIIGLWHTKSRGEDWSRREA